MFSVLARCLVACVALLCAAVALPAVAPARMDADRAAGRRARAARSECPNADLVPAAGNLAAIRAAVLCLHNRERAAHGLRLLRENARLRRAAAGHTGDMVERRYFAHDSPGGSGMVSRILGAGYVRGGEGWTLGENLAWATGDRATPAGVEKAWMASPDHRANILRRGFREIGVGVALGNPVTSPASAGATYTADFGVRR